MGTRIQPQEFRIRVDDKSEKNVVYIGKCGVGDQDKPDQPIWQIQKWIETTDGEYNLWCDGDIKMNNRWDDRTTLTYK